MSDRYESLEAFYADDERRRRSPELEFGVWWRRHELVYRLTWVEATGELAAVQLSPPTLIPLSRIAEELERVYLPARYAELVAEGAVGVFGLALFGGEAGSVLVLGVIRERDELERVLEGWAGICGAPDSLLWVRRQLVVAGTETANLLDCSATRPRRRSTSSREATVSETSEPEPRPAPEPR